MNYALKKAVRLFCLFCVFCGPNFRTLSYYYYSISCFLTKILHCAFLSREALSQPPSRRSRWIHLLVNFFCQTSLLDLAGPAARLFCLFCVFCGLNFRVFRVFRGSSRVIWLRLDRSKCIRVHSWLKISGLYKSDVTVRHDFRWRCQLPGELFKTLLPAFRLP